MDGKEIIQSGKYKVKVVNVSELEFLEKNARYMANDMFQNLVNNIKKDGELQQFPFCVLQKDGRYKVLSGNHRARAAKTAGLEEIPIIYTDESLTNDEQIAIQLSHNAISGNDDMVILKELYNEINDLSAKYYAGLDDKTLEQLEKLQMIGMSEAQLEYKTLQFMFLESEADRIIKHIESIENSIHNDTVLATGKDFDRILSAISKTKIAYNIHNGAVAIMLLLNLFENNQDQLQDGWIDADDSVRRRCAPMSSIFGVDYVPTASAKVISKAIDKMISKQDITNKNKCQIIEYLCAEYLAGG